MVENEQKLADTMVYLLETSPASEAQQELLAYWKRAATNYAPKSKCCNASITPNGGYAKTCARCGNPQ